MSSLTLLPAPRHLTLNGGAYELKANKRIVLQAERIGDLLFTAQRLQTALAEVARLDWALAATAPATETGVILRIDPKRAKQPQSYELTITPEALTLIAHDEAGLFYGACTLVQILDNAAHQPLIANPTAPSTNSSSVAPLDTQLPTHLPCLRISDYPDFPVRGVMLDISRDKVPTMATLYMLVEMLAAWKINQLQLYTEHTFTYRKHPSVWATASPMSEADILALDAYCRRRHIELVPNQNSFGHMHRWLKHPQYAPLGEVQAFDSPHWWGRTPFSLCAVDKRSLKFVSGLYDELLPNFSSHMVNVGCDETFDLGMGRSRAACKRRGTGRVYLDFLRQIYRDVTRRGYTMQYWGDIIINHPELIPELPKDAIALEWGYQAQHPFDAHGERFAASGVPFYVCPGTSSWNSLAGRTTNALDNLLNAAENGLKHGAVGYLNTDWGDHGHWQFLPMNYLGFAYGAGVSWCVQTNRALDVVAALNRFAFCDPSGRAGRVAYDMGNVYLGCGVMHNASGLVRALQTPTLKPGDPLAEIRQLSETGLDAQAFIRAEKAIARAMRPLGPQKMQRPDAALIAAEFECAADLLHHACGLGQLAWTEDARALRKLKRLLAADLQRIISEYRGLWLMRNRTGGLMDSVSRLENVLRIYA